MAIKVLDLLKLNWHYYFFKPALSLAFLSLFQFKIFNLLDNSFKNQKTSTNFGEIRQKLGLSVTSWSRLEILENKA